MRNDHSGRRRRLFGLALLAALAIGVGAGAEQVAAQGGHRVTVGGAPDHDNVTP